MVHVRVILLGLIRQLLLPCQGIALLVEPANDCLDAVPGDRCYKFVTWALEKGLEKHPEWFPSFKRSDSEKRNFEQIQDILYSRNKAGCGKPCFTESATPSPPDAEVQKTPVSEVQEGTPAEEAKPEAAPAVPKGEAKPALARERRQDQLEAPALAAEERAAPGDPLAAEPAAEDATGATGEENAPAGGTAASEPEGLPRADASGAEEGPKAPAGEPAATKSAAEAAPAAPAAEEAKTEAALAALSEVAKPADAPAPAAQQQPPRSNLIGKLEAEVKALDAMSGSPALKTLRAEKRRLIRNLQKADKLEPELKARQLRNMQTLNKLEAELKALEAMDDTPASQILREEKRAQIHDLQITDKLEADVKSWEIERLQDPATAAEEAAPAAPTAEEAQPEEQPPRSDLIGKLEDEVKAMDVMKDSPALQTLRAEKRQLIHNLQTADELEAELKARQLQNLQTLNKLEAELKALDAIDASPALETLRAEKNTQIQNLQSADRLEAEVKTREIQRLQDPAVAAEEAAPAAPATEKAKPEAAALGRKPWWQRRWREAKAEVEAVVEEAKAMVES